jgi:hypothetical protein
MSAPLEHWKILPHGPLTAVDDKVWTVTGTLHMPVGDFERPVSVVRLRDGGLVVYSAIALDEDEMARLDGLGRVAWLAVPGEDHRLDAKIWLHRYPNMHVAAPAGAREKALEVVPIESTTPGFGDPDVQWITVPGTREHEARAEFAKPRSWFTDRMPLSAASLPGSAKTILPVTPFGIWVTGSNFRPPSRACGGRNTVRT